jgi:hypothetical protein
MYEGGSDERGSSMDGPLDAVLVAVAAEEHVREARLVAELPHHGRPACGPFAATSGLS